MDLSSFALRLYENEILIYVRATANARGRVKSHGLSTVFKHRDPTLRASGVYTALRKKVTLLSFYFPPFVISTTMALEDGGSWEWRGWQLANSSLGCHTSETWINQRPWLVLFLPLSFSLSLCLSLFASPLFISLFYHFSSRTLAYYVSLVFPP